MIFLKINYKKMDKIKKIKSLVIVENKNKNI
jgi:hypothetical protein